MQFEAIHRSNQVDVDTSPAAPEQVEQALYDYLLEFSEQSDFEALLSDKAVAPAVWKKALELLLRSDRYLDVPGRSENIMGWHASVLNDEVEVRIAGKRDAKSGYWTVLEGERADYAGELIRKQLGGGFMLEDHRRAYLTALVRLMPKMTVPAQGLAFDALPIPCTFGRGDREYSSVALAGSITYQPDMPNRWRIAALAKAREAVLTELPETRGEYVREYEWAIHYVMDGAHAEGRNILDPDIQFGLEHKELLEKRPVDNLMRLARLALDEELAHRLCRFALIDRGREPELSTKNAVWIKGKFPEDAELHRAADAAVLRRRERDGAERESMASYETERKEAEAEKPARRAQLLLRMRDSAR